MDLAVKLGILADAAKYDASCSTSGSARSNTANGLGNGAIGGICHSWSADGRCVALLKVLLTNSCVYDCAYCVNRRSNDIPRASFKPEELALLIIDLYKRNYIEGAFLSSGVLVNPDTTMVRLLDVLRLLRLRERFNGYVHVKAIPGASDDLVLEMARWADRVSVNIELPSAQSLARIAPDKKPAAIFGPMRVLARASGFEPVRLFNASPEPPTRIPVVDSPFNESTDLPNHQIAKVSAVAEPRPLYDAPRVCNDGEVSNRGTPGVRDARRHRYRNPQSRLLPAGQTTQLVIGASPESDAAILSLAENLYLAYDVRRVYYSAYIPVVHADYRLPKIERPPLAREHRLYQADWLFRYYGFSARELFSGGSAFLDEDLDPKSSWALRNPDFYPVDLVHAPYNDLLRVPGIGPASASRILRLRREGPLHFDQLAKLGVVIKRARWFVLCNGHFPDPAQASRAAHFPDNMSSLRFLLSGSWMPGMIQDNRQLEFGWDTGR